MSSFVSALLVGCAVIFAANAAQGAPLQQDTYFTGNAANEWDNARDAGRLAREYAHHEIEAAENAVRWRFAPRETTFADIFLHRPLDRPFTEMVLRVRNAGAPLDLTVKLVDAGGAEYTVTPQPLPGAGEWQEVRFSWEQFKVASWSKDTDGRFDWPAGTLAVIAYGLKPATEYDVNIAAVTLRREPPVHLAAKAAALPAVVAAGGALTVRGEITPAQDYRSDEANEVQLLRGDQVVARAPLPQPVDWKAGQRVAFGPVRLEIPHFTWSGEHTVRLRLGFAAVDCAGSEGVLGRVRVQGRRPGKSVAAVRPYHGVPTLFLNGKPDAAMSYMTYHPNGKYFGQFGQAGIHLYTFSATPTEAAYNLSRETWTAPDHFDYSQTDERSLLVLSNDPDGYFFPRLYLRAPKWWTEAHPDELVTYDPGDGKPILFHHSGGMPVPSWASEVWRRDTADALRRYIRHMEESPWADRVIGYHIASGTTEEWMMWGGNENQWVDYSRPNREAFHRWLRAKYATDDALRRAWGDPSVTLETAAIPTRAQRATAAVFTLHDPATEQQVIDYTLYNSDLVADTIAYFAKVVKEATHREKLVGAFYGYVLQLAAEQRQQNAGHLALDKVLACPDIDFLTSPTSYAFRTPGTGYSHFMSLADSVRAHGKLWMDENDIRTWLTGGPAGVWGKTDTYEESLQQQQREFANVLGHGCGKWWFDMGGGWYDDPRLMKDIGGMAAIARQSLSWDRSPVDQIALVLDPRSLAYLRTGNALSGPLIMQQLPQLGHMGAPFGTYMLDDLERIPPHRLYLFVSCFAPTAAQRQMIDRVVKHDGRVAVWIYAPGIARDGRLDTAGMEALTGIHLQWAREEAPLQVQVAGTDALLVGLPADLSYGTAQPTGPLVYADDPKAQVLGRLTDGAHAGLVVRRFPEWTSVFSTAPALPSSLLRNLARAAGVHLYTDGDEVVYANQSVLAVNVNNGGAHTVHLPRPAKVTELFSGKVIGTGIHEFTAEIPAKGTALYHLEWGKSGSFAQISVRPQVAGRRTEMTIRREADRVWIEGVTPLQWGVSEECTFAGSLTHALAATRHPYDYATLMGASALAFRVRWFQGKEGNRWCPSSPIGEGPAEMEAIRKATGWGLSTEDASGEDEAKAAKLHDQIIAALETGTPVLAYDSGLNIMVVFGYEKGSSDLLAHAYGGGAEPSRWPVSKLPMMLIFLKKDGQGLSPDAVCREGLRLAMRNWQRGLMPAGAIGYWYGSSALEHWRADLAVADSYTDKEREQLFFVSWWNYDSLADARQAAVTYLEQSLPVLKGESRAAAAQALKIYQDEVSLLASAFKDGNAFFGPWSGKTVADWNEATRKREQEILATAGALEQQAMEYLAKAVL